MTALTAPDALDLCERALRLGLTLDEAERLWPDVPKDVHLAAVREDLLSALEHVPASRDHPTGDPNRWKQMPEYDDLARRVRELRDRSAGG